MSAEISKLNSLLQSKCTKNKLKFIQNENIFWKNGSVNTKLYLDDKIHLTSYGYKLFCNTLIQNMHKCQIKNDIPDPIINTATTISSSHNAYQQITQFHINTSDFPPLPSQNILNQITFTNHRRLL